MTVDFYGKNWQMSILENVDKPKVTINCFL